jgi:AcrR family transcriptional regulator
MTAVSERSALGRRGRTKGDRRQTAILDSTETLLAKQPWHQLSIAEITELAGISRSTFYFYFSSREALLGALLERVLEQAGREPDDGWLNRPSHVRPLLALRSTFSHILDQWESHGAVLSQAASMWSVVPALKEQWDRMQSAAIEQAASRIAHERSVGAAPPGLEPMQLSTALMWMSERVMSILVSESSTALPKADLVETLAFVWVRTIYLEDDPAP